MALGVSKRPPVSEREILLRELSETQERLSEANARFNMATQPELIEQCVYEINALKARHAYYIRVLREEDGL
ncbi:MAG: DUF2508 family protein [Oscillospiraceae bacterium]|jgi:hypothetical protein|nr:DUF2508 family protein [Oscillospiraceae bacterium]